MDPDDLLQFADSGLSPSTVLEGGASASLHRSVSDIAAHSFADSAVHLMDGGDSVSITSNYSLTEAQEKAISSKCVLVQSNCSLY